MKFLIVDDDLDMARFMEVSLKGEGIDSEIAGSAESARNLYLLHSFDALIVDGILPGESGIGLVNELRQISPNVPVLFCTGATDPFNTRLMSSLGMVCHKPLGTHFTQAIRQLIAACAK